MQLSSRLPTPQGKDTQQCIEMCVLSLQMRMLLRFELKPVFCPEPGTAQLWVQAPVDSKACGCTLCVSPLTFMFRAEMTGMGPAVGQHQGNTINCCFGLHVAISSQMTT